MGKNNGFLPEFQVNLTYYSPNGMVTGTLFYEGRKVAWWDEDPTDNISIYWVGDKKMNVNEDMLKEYISSKWKNDINGSRFAEPDPIEEPVSEAEELLEDWT
jgi:hypothetical protein